MRIDDYINNVNNWEYNLEKKNIEIKKYKNYILLKYGIMADFSDPIVQQCRGIIFKKENNRYVCVCRPFDKFFNYQEENAAEIDWSTARVQEKIDGSIVKLWFDDFWHWSTNGVIHAYDAQVNDFISFGGLIEKADNYEDIDFDSLDTNYTYMFELVSPYNKVVIDYDTIHLYHIGTRNNFDGVEVETDINIEKPRRYRIFTFEDCLEAVNEMNLTTVEQEGFVVVDGNYNRIKVKSPKYFLFHRMANNGALTSKRIIEIIKNGAMEDMIKQYPAFAEEIYKTNAAMGIYKYKAQAIINKARAAYEEFGRDRRAAAEVINTFEYPNIGYWGIDNKGNADDYINTTKENNYVKVIEREISKFL